MLYIFVSWLQNLSGRPYPFDIMTFLVSAVPLTQETRKFSVPELQSKQKCDDFQVRTNIPLVCFILMYCSKCFMLSSLSLIPKACATRIECNTFIMCRRIALRLNLEESMNSLHSTNPVNKPSTFLDVTRMPSMVKNSSRFFFFGDNDTELFSRLHPNISIVSFWMLAVRPLPLAAPNRVLDQSVRFV